MAERKWYPGGFVHNLAMYTVFIENLNCSSPREFAEHGAVTEVIKLERGYVLRFEDGTLSLPIEALTLSGQVVNPGELYLKGILTQEHLEEIQAEERAIKEEDEKVLWERMKDDMLESARDRLLAPHTQRLEEIHKYLSENFGKVPRETILELHQEASELERKAHRITHLSPEELLTPEELKQYNVS